MQTLSFLNSHTNTFSTPTPTPQQLQLLIEQGSERSSGNSTGQTLTSTKPQERFIDFNPANCVNNWINHPTFADNTPIHGLYTLTQATTSRNTAMESQQRIDVNSEFHIFRNHPRFSKHRIDPTPYLRDITNVSQPSFLQSAPQSGQRRPLSGLRRMQMSQHGQGQGRNQTPQMQSDFRNSMGPGNAQQPHPSSLQHQQALDAQNELQSMQMQARRRAAILATLSQQSVYGQTVQGHTLPPNQQQSISHLHAVQGHRFTQQPQQNAMFSHQAHSNTGHLPSMHNSMPRSGVINPHTREAIATNGCSMGNMTYGLQNKGTQYPPIAGYAQAFHGSNGNHVLPNVTGNNPQMMSNQYRNAQNGIHRPSSHAQNSTSTAANQQNSAAPSVHAQHVSSSTAFPAKPSPSTQQLANPVSTAPPKSTTTKKKRKATEVQAAEETVSKKTKTSVQAKEGSAPKRRRDSTAAAEKPKPKRGRPPKARKEQPAPTPSKDVVANVHSETVVGTITPIETQQYPQTNTSTEISDVSVSAEVLTTSQANTFVTMQEVETSNNISQVNHQETGLSQLFQKADFPQESQQTNPPQSHQETALPHPYQETDLPQLYEEIGLPQLYQETEILPFHQDAPPSFQSDTAAVVDATQLAFYNEINQASVTPPLPLLTGDIFDEEFSTVTDDLTDYAMMMRATSPHTSDPLRSPSPLVFEFVNSMFEIAATSTDESHGEHIPENTTTAFPANTGVEMNGEIVEEEHTNSNESSVWSKADTAFFTDITSTVLNAEVATEHDYGHDELAWSEDRMDFFGSEFIDSFTAVEVGQEEPILLPKNTDHFGEDELNVTEMVKETLEADGNSQQDHSWTSEDTDLFGDEITVS